MLITDMELRYAAETVSQLDSILTQRSNSRHQPALYNLQLRIPHAYSFVDRHDALLVTLDVDDGKWTPVGRLSFDSTSSADPKPFDHVFNADQACQLRVLFWRRPNDTIPIGQTFVNLLSIKKAAHERVEQQVIGLPRSRDTVEFSLHWLAPRVEKLLLYILVRIRKKEGWPFSMARPYFVIYRWETDHSSWKPIYRSEIVTRQSLAPDSKGAMVFQGVEVSMNGNCIHEAHTTPMRIEFFHFKTKSADKMLAYYCFNVQQMRQVAPSQSLDLTVSNFSEGELVGRLGLVESSLAYGKSTFKFEAAFGGDIGLDLIYIDMELNNQSTTEIQPVFFTLSGYTDQGTWEKFYKSERSPRLRKGESHRFYVAKMSERKVCAGRKRRSLSIGFFRDRGRKPTQLGHFETTLSDLFENPPGSTIALEGADRAYVRIERVEKADLCGSILRIGICCEYGSIMPPSPIQKKDSNDHRLKGKSQEKELAFVLPSAPKQAKEKSEPQNAQVKADTPPVSNKEDNSSKLAKTRADAGNSLNGENFKTIDAADKQPLATKESSASVELKPSNSQSSPTQQQVIPPGIIQNHQDGNGSPTRSKEPSSANANDEVGPGIAESPKMQIKEPPGET